MQGSRWLVALLTCVLAVGSSAGPNAKGAEEPGKVFIYDFGGPLREAPPAFEFDFDMEQPGTLRDLIERFREAKTDESVKAVVLTFNKPYLGWAQMQELRQAVLDLRAAEKDVYCYLEEVGAAPYQLATACSHISIAPVGGINISGINAEMVYFKGLLDKIGVQADIESCGAYKDAGEPFTRTEPSEQSREMLNWLIEDIYDQMIETIAEGRHLTKDVVRDIIDRGPFTSQQALEAGLVDEIRYADELVEKLRDRYGYGVVFSHDYGKKKGPDVDWSSPFAIFKLFGEAMKGGKETGKPGVGVIYVDGMIVTGKTEHSFFGESGAVGSTTIRRALERARDLDYIKSVVLRVNSPGGSATASDIIWHATQIVGQDKPFVVSMGNVAASGGYYVSCGADTIFADASSITGSIGVVGGKIVTTGLWDWLGVSFHNEKKGQNADLYSSRETFNERKREIVRGFLEDVYTAFKDRVTDGRGERLRIGIDEVAGGRVFTGRQAYENGLVDRLGGLQDAIKFAAAEANLDTYEIHVLPEPRNFMDAFMKSFTGQGGEADPGDHVSVRTSSVNGSWLGHLPGIEPVFSAIRALDPQRARAVMRALHRIEMLGNENILLVTPTEIVIE